MAVQNTGNRETQRRAIVSAPVARTAATSSASTNPTAAIKAFRIVRGESDTVLRVLAGERYVLGRHDAADIVFDAADVSRLHGVLRAGDTGAWVYEDYGSQNGTTLVRADGIVTVRAHEPVALTAYDLLELGGDTARIELLPESDVPPEELVDETATSTELSRAARAFAEKVRLAGRTRVPVFLLGPSGVGKTFTARQIHDASGAPGPFVPINCARLPVEPTALHSELLGHVRGAYTGAEAARTGKLVFADGGTLFLDEVESLPPLAQGFLLDVLEGSGDLSPLGASSTSGPRLKPITFRLVSASKAPLAESGLRSDLCERLAEGHLWRVPGLEERKEDIPGLARRFAEEQAKMLGAKVTVSPGAVRFCVKAKWPGQVRQLRAAITALAQLGLARAEGAPGVEIHITETDLAGHLRERDDAFGVREDAAVPTKANARALTREHLLHALHAASYNQAKAARDLGIARNTLRKKMEELGLLADANRRARGR